ncbi:MAG: hypothetical protein AB9903_02370 [Vulcanimicrobiota bacterium]
MKRRSEKGFSGIEVQISCAVIAILAAIIVPNVIKAHKNATEQVIMRPACKMAHDIGWTSELAGLWGLKPTALPEGKAALISPGRNCLSYEAMRGEKACEGRHIDAFNAQEIATEGLMKYNLRADADLMGFHIDFYNNSLEEGNYIGSLVFNEAGIPVTLSKSDDGKLTQIKSPVKITFKKKITASVTVDETGVARAELVK